LHGSARINAEEHSMNEAQQHTLQRLQGRIDELPLLPAVVQQLMQLNPNDDDYFDSVLNLVNLDPTFATRLLRYANSAFVGSLHSITSVQGALAHVGSKGAVDLILAHSAIRIFLPKSDWERALWNHAIFVACLMREMAAHAREIQVNPGEAHTFGLLHDIGRFVLYLEAPEDLRKVDETEWESPQALVEAETSICGFTHAELGFLALQKWKLPVDLALAVRYHHGSQSDLSNVPLHFRPMVRLLHEADWLAVTIARRGDEWQTISVAEVQALLSVYKEKFSPFAMETQIDVVLRAVAEAVQMRDTLGLVPAAGR
jgi:putative nucleotidyltransferase with HDIG domain